MGESLDKNSQEGKSRECSGQLLACSRIFIVYRMRFSNRTNSPHNCHYNIAGAQLQSVRSQRDLGVVISNTLSWQQHYTKLCQKAYNALHLIKRTLSASASVNLKKTIVHLTGQVPLLFLLPGVETQVRERYSNAGKNAKKGNEIHP